MAGEDDWDMPTPRDKTSGSWLGLRDIAVALSTRLDLASRAKTSSNLILRDLEGAEQCVIWVERLSELATDFERWPNDPDKASRERVGHTHELFELVRRAGELLARMPVGPW